MTPKYAISSRNLIGYSNRFPFRWPPNSGTPADSECAPYGIFTHKTSESFFRKTLHASQTPTSAKAQTQNRATETHSQTDFKKTQTTNEATAKTATTDKANAVRQDAGAVSGIDGQAV